MQKNNDRQSLLLQAKQPFNADMQFLALQHKSLYCVRQKETLLN
jgi:hypothetical protein